MTGLLGNVIVGIGICVLGLIGLSGVVFYAAALDILKIIYSVQLLSDPHQASRPARYLAMMQIINVLFFQFFPFLLVFLTPAG